MSWKRLALSSRPAKIQSRLHLDESVPASVERLLNELGYRFSTSRSQGLSGHSDVDQAAFCWRERHTLLTFDWDFFGVEELPHHRTPGIVVVDCDRRSAKDVFRAIDTLARFEHAIGAVERRMLSYGRTATLASGRDRTSGGRRRHATGSTSSFAH